MFTSFNKFHHFTGAKTAVVFFLLLLTLHIHAQVQPANNSVLNFTQVLFEVPEVKGAVTYEFRLAEEGGNLESPLVLQKDSSQVTIISGLEFGKNYQWKVTAFNEKKERMQETTVYFFKTGTSPFIDPKLHRFRVIKNTPSENENGFIFLDYSRVAIDRAGKPVWYLPKMEGMNVETDRVRDLELSSRGTITFNAMKLCRETTLGGKTIWETPKPKTDSLANPEAYHHEFTRLQSGNYIVLGTAFRNRALTLGRKKIDKIPVSVIIEYSPQHDTTWSWYSDFYISDSDLVSVGQKVFRGSTYGHMNAVSVNETTGEVYACFRDLSAIVVIDQKTGKVVRSYGDKIPSDTTKQAIGFFKKQHTPVLMPGGKIILFNNNEPGADSVSRVLIFTEAYSPQDSSTIDWEFRCDFDTLAPGYSSRLGNAQPIDSTHYLVDMGSVARLFEVNRDKKVTWDCFPESRMEDTAQWQPESNYRLFFTKSLYPCYFSFSVRSNAAGGYFLYLVNEGCEADQYTIRIIPGTNEKKAETYSASLQGGTSFSLPLSMLSDKNFRHGFTVEVRSKKNNELLKRTTYPAMH